MRKRRLFLLLIAGVVLVGLLVALFPREHEPEYEGRKLSEWVAISSGNATPADRRRVAQAYDHIGTNALPYVLRWLRDEGPPKWARQGRAMLENVLRRPAFDWGDDKRRLRTIEADSIIRRLGPQALSAINDLGLLYTNATSRVVRENSGLCLRHLGPAGVSVLIAGVTNQSVGLRRYVADWIGYQGTNARSAIPFLLKSVAEDDDFVAGPAAHSLGRLKLEPELAVPVLIDALRHRPLQEEAAAALGNFGDAARPAVPLLLQCLDPEDKTSLVDVAVESLGKLKLDPAIVVPRLTKIVMQARHPDRVVTAAVALGEFGDKARFAVPALLPLLTNEDWSFRYFVTNALRKIDPGALDRGIP